MISVAFVDVYRQNLHSSQLGGDNQTDTSNRLLVTMPKFLEIDSLNVLVQKQGEEERLRHACVLISDRNSV